MHNINSLDVVRRASTKANRTADTARNETVRRDNAILAALEAGETMRAVAAAAGLSLARVHQIANTAP